ncbi:MAG TPA: 3-oxoacyl-[acyl-carrier-protein] reductase [Clostridia bacterium]|nr:3-oxoacyl-[acyl-carrier-protein] reductase [Clostridia bacterium]
MLNGKTAIVTGASRGIGKAIALTLASRGANIALIYAGNDVAANNTLEELREFPVKAEAYRCDVSDFCAAKEAVDKIIGTFGGVDILINNAGITRDALMISMKEADFDAVVNTSLKGSYNMLKHVAPQFIKKRSGRIINISSVAGLMGNAGQVNYSAAKAGMIGLTKAAAKELAPRGITCNAIAPGLIETDMTEAMNASAREALRNAVPLKRAGTAEDVAELAAFLCGPQAGYITGEVIRVDGGLAM